MGLTAALDNLSHLLQMRGLKLSTKPGGMMPVRSHLLQMRGLKQQSDEQKYPRYVASFTDAWIETLTPLDLLYANWQSHLLQMRGLKPIATYSTPGAVVASFTDAWIETLKFGCHLTYGLSHLLQMRGLKLKLVL